MNDDSITLDITAMAYGGHALGRHDQRTIFVPYTIPGETITARVVDERGRVAFAEGVSLVTASADRVFPKCPHFGPGRCGRCQWQHIDYAAQVLLKQDVLADQLARIGGFDEADVRPILPSPVEWDYNHRMTLMTDAEGRWGFQGTWPGHIQPIDECHILHPDLLALLGQIDFEAERIHRMSLQIDTAGETMIVLYVDEEADAPELAVDLQTSVNLILPDNTPINLIGDTNLRYTVAGRQMRVTVGVAFRGNVGALDGLVQTVLAQIPTGPDVSVLDLYGGAGIFSALIAPQVDVVTLVESYPPAATDADANTAEFDNVDILEGTVEDVLGALDQAETAYSVALMDPPAEGLSRDAVDALGASGISRLVYVASDPATLARDAKRLTAQGYTLGPVYPLDLNPQTYYVDAVAVFNR
jgi:23S rRNA (uracil1939-C5)-methyltransferase